MEDQEKKQIRELSEAVLELAEKVEKRRDSVNKEALVETAKKEVLETISPLIKNQEQLVDIVKRVEADSNLTKEELVGVFSEALKESFKGVKTLAPAQIESEPLVKAMKEAFQEVRVEAPNLKVPEIPQPKIDVKPADIKFPKFEFPKSFSINNLASFTKSFAEALGQTIKVKITGITKKDPLPVMLYYKGKPYLFGANIDGVFGGPMVSKYIKNINTTVDNGLIRTRDISVATPTTTRIVLTNAYTDYKLPTNELTDRVLVLITNNADKTVYVGQTGVINAGTPSSATPIGIPVVPGATMTLRSNRGLYATCANPAREVVVTEFTEAII